MSIHMNIHPHNKWESINIKLHEKGSGSCLAITLTDTNMVTTVFAIHFGEDRDGLIQMFNQAVTQMEGGE